MKTALIFTGGTIGSTQKNGRIAPDTQTSSALTGLIDAGHAQPFDFVCASPYMALSESLNGTRLNRLIACVREQMAAGAQAAIVFHGTDTLAYTAAALGYAFGNGSIPIVLVSANHPADDARSNAKANLFGALDFLTQTNAHGVFVVYKNQKGTVFVHRGTRLLAQAAFDDAVFSAAGQYFGCFTENGQFQKNPGYNEEKDELEPFADISFCENSGVLHFLPRPGMPLPAIAGDIKAVLLDSYHSGSIGTESRALQAFCREAQEKEIPIFLTGQKSSYESAAAFKKLHIQPLECLPPVSAYIKAWALSSTDCDWTKMTRSLGGDRILLNDDEL